MLFFTEMWERVSYYGMRALLVLYMVKGLQYANSDAYSIYGAYTGLVYMTPLLGGMLADRLIGNRRAIIAGCILMALGEFALMIETPLFFFGGLGILIIGNGLFKPNMSTIVGKIYDVKDPRRDGAFTIFYMGINLGAFLAPLTCGIIGEKFGWKWGFGLSGIGMLLGLIIFIIFKKHLGDKGAPPNPEALNKPVFAGISKNMLWIAGAVLCIPIVSLLVSQAQWIKILIPVFGILFIVYITFESFRSTKQEAGSIFTIVILMVFSMTFWACFEQAGSSINIFTDTLVDKTIFKGTSMAFTVPTTVFQSINPFFIIALGVPFSMLWSYLGKTKLAPSSPFKMALGILQLALGFLVMVYAAKAAANGMKASLWLIVLAYFLHTTGELCVSPVGLSMVTKLAPVRLAALLMGAWFLSNSFANVIGGAIATLTSGDAGYESVFMLIVKVATVVGVTLLFLTPLLKKLAGKKF